MLLYIKLSMMKILMCMLTSLIRVKFQKYNPDEFEFDEEDVLGILFETKDNSLSDLFLKAQADEDLEQKLQHVLTRILNN